jgi:hypothetical protein
MLRVVKARQTELAMLKDFEDRPPEPARKKAERRWRNHDVEKRFKEEKAKPKTTRREPKDLEIGETISNKKPDGRGSLIRARTKFAKDIRMMMEGHAKRNLALYVISIRAQRNRLLREKLRRLEAREAQRLAQQGESNA